MATVSAAHCPNTSFSTGSSFTFFLTISPSDSSVWAIHVHIRSSRWSHGRRNYQHPPHVYRLFCLSLVTKRRDSRAEANSFSRSSSKLPVSRNVAGIASTFGSDDIIIHQISRLPYTKKQSTHKRMTEIQTESMGATNTQKETELATRWLTATKSCPTQEGLEPKWFTRRAVGHDPTNQTRQR